MNQKLPAYFFAFAARLAAQYFFIRALTALRAAADIDLRLRPSRRPAALAAFAAFPNSGNAFRIAWISASSSATAADAPRLARFLSCSSESADTRLAKMASSGE